MSVQAACTLNPATSTTSSHPAAPASTAPQQVAQIHPHAHLDSLPKLRIGVMGASKARIFRPLHVAHIDNPATTCTLTTLASDQCQRAKSFVNLYLDEEEQKKVKVADEEGEDGYERLLKEDCDAVYVPLPTSLHKEWVNRALRAGKHVLVASPPAISYSDYLSMLRTAKQAGKYLQDATVFLHHPRLNEFFDLVCDTATFGPITKIVASHTFLGSDHFFASDDRANKELYPLGCIGDVGWYCIRAGVVLLHKVGKANVESAQVVDWKKTPNGLVVDATCHVHFMEGRLLQFHCSYTQSSRQKLEVISPTKIATISDFVGLNSFQVKERVRQPWVGGCGTSSSKYLDQSMERTENVQFRTGPSEGVMMWRGFARLARGIDESVAAEREKRAAKRRAKGEGSGEDDEEGVLTWGHTDAAREASLLSGVSLQTQRIVSALVESIEKGGEKIELSPVCDYFVPR